MVETNPSSLHSVTFQPSLASPGPPSNFSSFLPERSGKSTFTHQTASNSPGEPFQPLNQSIGSLPHTIAALLPPQTHSTCMSAADFGSQRPAVAGCPSSLRGVKKTSTPRVSRLLKAHHQQSSRILVSWTCPFEACDRGFAPFVLFFPPLSFPKPILRGKPRVSVAPRITQSVHCR